MNTTLPSAPSLITTCRKPPSTIWYDLSISPDALKSPGATWDQNIPWPNGHEDYYGPRDYTGSIVAGSTFGIPMSVNLNSLGLSQGGMMLAKALQNYGGIWRTRAAATRSHSI